MFRKEIGAYIYRRDEMGLSLMLVNNRKQTRWILPKGQPEHRQSDIEVALDEAYEEAGVIGCVDEQPPAVISYTSSTGGVHLHVYRMQIERLLEKWPEHFFRQREMVDVETALLMVRKKALREGIEQIAADILAQK